MLAPAKPNVCHANEKLAKAKISLAEENINLPGTNI